MYHDEHSALLDEILDVVAFATRRDRSQLRLDASPSELGIDSLDMIETIFALENRFHIEIPWNANDASDNAGAISFDTVGELSEGVIELIGQKTSVDRQDKK